MKLTKEQLLQEKKYNLPYHWFPKTRLETYEFNSWKRIVFYYIDQYMNLEKNMYLDVGCGDGRWTAEVANYLDSGVQTYGVDYSERAIGFAQLISPEIKFGVGSAAKLDFPDATFDLVTMMEVIEHIEDQDELKVLSEIKRVLKPAGLLIFSTPSTNVPKNAKHFRHYSQAELTKKLNDSGFKILEFKGNSEALSPRMNRLRNSFLDFPVLWKFWKSTAREINLEKAIYYFIAAESQKL